MPNDWETVLRIAEEEVRAVIVSLPVELRQEAEKLPVNYDSRRDEDLQPLDLDGTLGLFVGASHMHELEELDSLPPQIILFLFNLWEFVEHDTAAFRSEVRTTYLHELGHYLGLEETDLEDRGLL